MKYQIKLSNLTYQNFTTKKVYNENELISLVDSSYMSLKQFIDTVYNELEDAFESDWKRTKWKLTYSELKSSNFCENIQESLDELKNKYKHFIDNELKRNKIDANVIVNSLNDDFIITIQEKQNKSINEKILHTLVSNLKQAYSFIDVYTKIKLIYNDDTINFAMSQYANKSYANFSASDNHILESNLKRFNIFEISNTFSYGDFRIYMSDVELLEN